MRFIYILSVFIVRKLSSLNDVRMVYGGVVMMSFEVVFCRDVIRNTTTLAMTRHGEVLFPILLEYPVSLFLSRFRSRRVRRTTCYLTVYEPVLYVVLGLADGVIGRTSIRDDRLPSFRVMKHEIIFSGKFVIHFKVFQVVDVVILTFSQVFVDTLAVEVVVGGIRQPRVFVLVDRLDIFVSLIDIVFEAFADVFTQVSVNWWCWSIRINVVSEIVLLEHRI